MNEVIQIIKAEVKKQHRNTFHSTRVYFSLLIWPIITFINAYYSYKPFNLSSGYWRGFSSTAMIISFLITGFLGYICFWSLVQSAWQMGFERQNGTLETIFQSPANRLTLIYGRALGALFESVWMFCIFCILIIVCVRGITLHSIIYIPVSFVVLLLSAVVWGGLMNVIFLFSRDASILFNIFDEPMSLFSGVRIPTSVFPIWAKVISVVFPLTHSLTVIRSLLLNENSIEGIKSVFYLLVSILAIIVITILLLKKAEKHARRTGNLTFY